MHNSSRRDNGQLKAKKLKTVFIQHTVNKITLSFHFHLLNAKYEYAKIQRKMLLAVVLAMIFY